MLKPRNILPSRRFAWLYPCICLSLGLAACGPSAEPGSPDADAVVFADATANAGLDFRHDNGMFGERYFVEMVGSGAALFDYDNDGDLDLYLVQGHSLEDPEDGPDEAKIDRLYRNDLTSSAEGEPVVAFVDVTEESGLRAGGYGMGVATGDYDNDGWTDLYITNYGSNQLWRNLGDGRFEDRTAASGADDTRWSVSSAFFDYDADGWLDLMVVNYVDYAIEDNRPCHSNQSGERDYCGPSAYPPTPDRLFRNRGDGTFEDATLKTGMNAAFGPGLGVVTGDFDADGWIDVYVANDGATNQLWMNQAGQRFVDRGLLSGSGMNAYGNPEASMGLILGDLDNDGDEDLYMTHLSEESNTLYLNDGAATFEDRSDSSGLGKLSLGLTGFGTAALDFDQDGWLDIFVANGAVRVIPEQLASGDPLPMRQRNQLLRNAGGARYEDASAALGDAGKSEAVSRGVASGDIDNDGDADLVISNNHGPAQLLLNTTGQERSWIGIDARVGGRSAQGARIALMDEDGSELASRRVGSDGSYASANDPRVRFGLGSSTRPMDVRVSWPGPDGRTEVWPDLALGAYHILEQGSAP